MDSGAGRRGDRTADRSAVLDHQTWTILRERLGWSRQRPARRAVERDDEAINRWVKMSGRA
ncbi:winged helix-turn-helix domain-containing protein [Saccharopolyspora sp. NPDC000995]